MKLLLMLLLGAQVVGAESKPLQISAWYWLNSAPRSEWARDFENMRELGFTDVVLCWGLDAAAWTLRQKDTRYALRACQRAHLGAYLTIWHPEHNSLPRRPEFQQVDVAGHLRFTFDTFNPTWRRTQWKSYLQQVATLYGREPAIAGYLFDDSFEVGSIGSFGGQAGPPAERIISYGEVEQRAFGTELPRKSSEPAWKKWMEARAGWWEEWARDTLQSIRGIDPNHDHEIYIEDGLWALSPEVSNAVGLDFGRMAKQVDAIGAYTMLHWDDSPESGMRAAEETRKALERTRAAVGPDQQIIYTFWVANGSELRDPGPARFPTVKQIRQICEAALQFGIRHLDMYGYRIGDARVSAEEWPRRRPPPQGPYPLTGQYPGKFLFDRKELHEGLRVYLRGLTSTGSAQHRVKAGGK